MEVPMFVGRQRELTSLESRYNENKFHFIPIYGRRRVGKTELIKEFIKNKDAIYFTAIEAGEKQNLFNFSQCINEFITDFQIDASYDTFDAAFDVIDKLAHQQRLVLVIDEYPYLASNYKAISSILQKYIDHKFNKTNLFIILCGSSMSFMEHQVLGYQSPLYGRRTGQIKLEPFGFRESGLFFSGFDQENKAIAYGITGGIPKYLEMMNDSISMSKNIINQFFTMDALLYEEPSNLLKQELREPKTYNDILIAIANGASKLNEIVTKTKAETLDTSKATKYLHSLMSLGIIKKEYPFAEQKSKRSIYRINDGMFRFWYRFVQNNISRINLGFGGDVYTKIEPQLSAFMGDVFEKICTEWLWQEYHKNNLPFEINDCGRWWGNNPLTKSESEIDILAYDDTQTKALFCECKWTNEKVGMSIYNDLQNKSRMFAQTTKYYILFSKAGFTDELVQSVDTHTQLVTFKQMF